ncbi:kinase-like protein [Artomyces pyxidatus]|uniref:Kinase-like protein n=1 Tax=Artomyces pyxidatus TaxID=48021 RepID=A0ACB8T2Y0_9AGAM|nr:kinase-like protein [Artomyces pyxidatus]
MLQYTVHPPPLSFSNASKKNSQSGSSSFRFLSNDPSKSPRRQFSPHSALTQKRPVDDLPEDHLPAAISISPLQFPLSVSTSYSSSSLPSPSFPPASLPKQVPRHSHYPSRPDSLMELSPALSSRHSARSSHIEDVLSHGDLVGEGISLQGEHLRLVPIDASHQPPADDYLEPAKEFEVVRRLGTGSYAVVYLVREVLSRPTPSEDDHIIPGGRLELDESSFGRAPIEYGREYAIKLLSKADLDEEALAAQLSEATIHQSLPPHPNIVTLHRTLETSAFLLLLLEYVPGEDLFYFLEQARDHYDADPSTVDTSFPSSQTPPTPGLLSSMHPDQLLSHTRLRLIASMFSQMCEAVAVCHDTSVFHRDIKPENFIVTDGWTTNPDGTRERKVVVKLTDFGLSTTDVESYDMDCGSAPYMSYECRNNVAPVYKPRAADVWSLGIVLVNMLYHYNPWTDTAHGGCSSFEQFRQQPISFLMQRFTGMTLPVANFLVDNVFCILDDPTDDSQRIGAREFSAWVKDLPTRLGPQQHARPTHSRVASAASITGHPISSVPPSRRPSSRASMANASPLRPPVALSGVSRSRAPSLGPAFEHDLGEFEREHGETQLPPVLDQEDEEEHEDVDGRSVSRRSTSTKRRKRGARKGKGTTPTSDHDQTSDMLASASQTLARELSRASKTQILNSPSTTSIRSRPPIPDTPPPVPTSPVVVKKPSKWKLSFGKSSAERAVGDRPSPIGAILEPPTRSEGSGNGAPRQMGTTAQHVSSLIMGLNADDAPTSFSRGRQPKATPPPPLPLTSAGSDLSEGWGPASARSPGRSGHGHAIEQWATSVERRGASPTSSRSGRPLASSASSMASSNWRSSMASTNTSTSAFTKYSNPSVRSVSTYATSVSSSSSNWRNAQSKPPSSIPATPSPSTPSPHSARGKAPFNPNAPPRPPPNVKIMSGVPWELSELPRQLHPNPNGDVFTQPPMRKPRPRKPKSQKLDTINERPGATPQKRDATPMKSKSSTCVRQVVRSVHPLLSPQKSVLLVL